MQQHATLLANNVASCLHGVIRYEQTDATTRNIISQQCCGLFARGYTLRANECNYFQHCGANNVASCLHGVIRYEQTDAITSNIVAPTMLRPVYTGLYATSKRMQLLPTLWRQQCCVLFTRGYTLRANGCNYFQHCGANNVASCLHGVIRYEQTDAITSNIVAPTMLRPVYTGLYATSKRMQLLPTLWRQQCCVLFTRGYTLRANGCNYFQHCGANNIGCCWVGVVLLCKRTKHVKSDNFGSCWPTILRPFARG